MALSKRPTYSIPALTKYMNHISLPAPQTKSILQNFKHRDWSTSSDALKSLCVLQNYQQAKIPFANLYLHYSKHHVGTLDPYELYGYIVNSGGIARDGGVSGEMISEGYRGVIEELRKGRTERERRWEGREPSGGRGGSCALNNGFFGTVMRSLNMSVKCGGARVSKAIHGKAKDVFGGWDHMINLLSFEGRKFLVDVGFGPNGPTTPVELVDGLEVPWGVTGDRVRVIWRSLPEFESPDERCWILQHKRERDEEWMNAYAFTEIEFLPQDIENMNYKTTRDIRGSFFNQMVICVRTIMEEGDVVGVVSMTDGKVKQRIRGVNETLTFCESEVERWEALEKWFGIVLGEQERLGIKGLGTELKGGPKDE